MSQISKFLGIDAGGTFTDFVLVSDCEWRIHKVLSTPQNPAVAILQGIRDMALQDSMESGELAIVHGSTVATNAALERKGAKTVYIANKGFADVLTIARQARQELYNLQPVPVEPPVHSELCLEVDCRRDAKGNIVKSLTDVDIENLVEQINALEPEAVAINLLFSYLNDEEEKRLEFALQDSYFVSRSSKVLPKYKEYERGIATWLNASLGPKVNQYMQSLMQHLGNCPVSIMQSSGGTMAIHQAAVRAVNLLLSGPAGGLAAIRTLGKLCGEEQLISFDMGGTSTDVALMDGDFKLTDEGKINHWPVSVPMLEMDTIGAGGGSIAWLDEANMLHVGPQSAGSDPGPACYGKGGQQVTVTDANVVLGRLQPEAFLGGNMTLDKARSEQVIGELGAALGMSDIEVAEGIVALAEQQMSQALHGISVQKGYDPAQFILCCFGGAGGMHVCSLAEKMNMRKAIVPLNSGVLSAYGMLTAPRQRNFVRSYICEWQGASTNEMEHVYKELETEGIQELLKEHVAADEIQIQRSLDMRYKGQSFTLSVPYSSEADIKFIEQHLRQYGHTLDAPVEVVNVSVNLSCDAISLALPEIKKQAELKAYAWVDVPNETGKVAVFDRADFAADTCITGPAIVTEKVSTTWIKSGWEMTVDGYGNLMLWKQ